MLRFEPDTVEHVTAHETETVTGFKVADLFSPSNGWKDWYARLNESRRYSAAELRSVAAKLDELNANGRDK